MDCSSCGRALEEGARIVVFGPDVFNVPPHMKGNGVWCEPCIGHHNRHYPEGKGPVQPMATVIAEGLGFLRDGDEEPETWNEWVEIHWTHYGSRETSIVHYRETGEKVTFNCPEVG